MKLIVDTNKMIESIKILSKIKGDILISSTGDMAVTLVKENDNTILQTSIFCYECFDCDKNHKLILPGETAELIKKLKHENTIIINDSEIAVENKVIKFESKIPPECKEYIFEEVFRTDEKELHRMLEVKYAMAQDEMRPVFAGIYFNKNETCALDGYRLSMRTGAYYSNKSFIVNKDTINILNSLLDSNRNEKVTVYKSDNKAKFSIGTTINIIGDLIDGEFIDYKNIIPNKFDITSKIDISILKKELDLINSIKTNVLRMTFDDDLLTLYADQCKEEYDEYASRKKTEELQKLQKVYRFIPIGSITSKIPCKVEVNTFGSVPFKIAVNPKYLNDTLKIYSGDIQLSMGSSIAPIVITQDMKNLELTLPIRIME